MSTITKERNLINICIEDGKKPYIIDISDGKLYGLRGNPIKKAPVTVLNAIKAHSNQSNVTKLLYAIDCHESKFAEKLPNYSYYLGLWDKLDSVNYHHPDHYTMTNETVMTTVDKNFKKFVKFIKENPDGTIQTFYNELIKQNWLAKYNIEIDEHFTENMYFVLSRSNFTEEQTRYAIYQFRKGLYDFLDYNYSNNSISLLANYFRYCDLLEMEYEKTDFIRAYNNAKKNYEFRKTEIDNARLRKVQLNKEKALYFSHGNLETIIPTTTEEFFEEAEMQSNCVARLYLPKVLDEVTNIVFIRKKDDMEHSYITCEVRNGRIYQYLGRHNKGMYDEESTNFYNLYEEHLSKNW